MIGVLDTIGLQNSYLKSILVIPSCLYTMFNTRQLCHLTSKKISTSCYIRWMVTASNEGSSLPQAMFISYWYEMLIWVCPHLIPVTSLLSKCCVMSPHHMCILGMMRASLILDIAVKSWLHYSTTQIPGHHKLCLIYFFSVEVVWIYT
mgnify:CR=1 FL=1